MSVVIKKAYFSDRVINIFVKGVLKARGSKKLFENGKTAENYLLSLKNRDKDIICPNSKRCKVTEFACGEMQCISFLPEKSNGKKIIYLPGGALVRQPTSVHCRFVEKTASKTLCEVILCVYPKVPEYTYSDTLFAVAELYRELIKHSSPDDITVMGDSAGGTVAVLLPDFLIRRSLPVFGKMILISPMLTVSPTTAEVGALSKTDPMLGVDGLAFFAKRWCGEFSDENDPMRVCLESLPPTFVFCGENDLLTYYSELFVKKAEKCGRCIEMEKYTGMYHVFPFYPLHAASDVKKTIYNLLN